MTKQHRRLRGRRIAVLAADGFEKVELTVPVAALRLGGAKVDIISLRRGRIRGVNLHEPASRVRVDGTVYDTDPRRYDGLLVRAALSTPICCGSPLRRAGSFSGSTRQAGRSLRSVTGHGCWPRLDV